MVATEPTREVHAPAEVPRRSYLPLTLSLLLLALGIAARVSDTASWRRTGPDELMYRRYVQFMDGFDGAVGVFPSDKYAQENGGRLVPYKVKIESTGAAAMPEMVDFYLETQRSDKTLCELPPTRFLYIYASWLWKRAQFGSAPPLSPEEMRAGGKPGDYSGDADHRDPALTSLHRVACAASILLMIVTVLFATRMLGPIAGTAVLAITAFDPVLLHLSQHAMVDGFFALLATLVLWTTWECLRNPQSTRWLVAHGAALALLVMTKENAFFVCAGLGAAILTAWWMGMGKVTGRFLLVTFLGCLFGLCALVFLAGGPSNFIEIYGTLVKKAQNLQYAQMTGDGPWYRYLVDLMVVNPVVLCLALAGVAALARRKELAWLAAFIAGSYLVMCNVRYGMNLRYTTIWSVPMAALAVTAVGQLAALLRKRSNLAFAIMIAGISAYEARQYVVLAMNPERPLYELVPDDLLHQIKMLKG